MKRLLLLLLVGCIPVTPSAAMRRMEAGRLGSCYTTANGMWGQGDQLARHQCMLDSVARCKGLGLEADCAVGDLITEIHHP